MSVIDVQTAEVKTMGVQIRALTIGSKQVTLSVFRQLLDEPLNDNDGSARGEIWGRVNYFWGDCKPGTHLHVVWQHGEELRRACVHTPHISRFPRHNELNEALFTYFVVAGKLDTTQGFGYYDARNYTYRGEKYERLTIPQGYAHSNLAYDLKQRGAKEGAGLVAVYQEELDVLHDEAQGWLWRTGQVYNACLAAPHLFIAV